MWLALTYQNDAIFSKNLQGNLEFAKYDLRYIFSDTATNAVL